MQATFYYKIIAFFVGFWALYSQFIFNRLIFFYVTNSDFSTAAAISLHLLGFLMGCLVCRSFSLARFLSGLSFIALLLVAAAKLLLWDWGMDGISGLWIVGGAALFSFLIAFIAGIISYALIEKMEAQAGSIVIWDSIGSVAGAAFAGFVGLPVLGITASFAIILTLQIISLFTLCCLRKAQWGYMLVAGAVLALSFVPILSMVVTSPYQMVKAAGFPLPVTKAEASVIDIIRSPYGVISVYDQTNPETNEYLERVLVLDSKSLCSLSREPAEKQEKSEWIVGRVPTQVALSHMNEDSPKKVAIIGLGCGTTLDAALTTLPKDWKIDLIEINPQMVQAHQHFEGYLTHTINDPRVNLITDEGFRFFREAAKNPGQYDAVIIDVALGEGLSVAHLLTKEMFANIHATLTDKGVIALWTAERQPFSPVSVSLFTTIYHAGFPSVYVGADRRVLLYGQKAEYNMREYLSDFSIKITQIASDLSWDAPVNTLDSLIVNRMPYDHQAFINWRPWYWGQEKTEDKNGL